jgi:hypothetical protein
MKVLTSKKTWAGKGFSTKSGEQIGFTQGKFSAKDILKEKISRVHILERRWEVNVGSLK